VTANKIALAFVGSLIADEPRFHGPAFNRASQMFQKEIVRGLARAGLEASAIYSIEPMPAFPRGRRLLARGGRVTVDPAIEARLIPFVNVQPLKPITAGFSVLFALLKWGWRHRRQPRLIHCINLTMPPGLFVLLGARLIGATATVSLLDIYQPGEIVPDRFRWRLDYALQKMLMPRFDGHMVVADAIAEDFLPGRRVCRIEGGILPEDFVEPDTNPEESRTRPVFRVVLAGSLWTHNGVEIALDAVERLPPAGFELVIAGTGPLADMTRSYAQKDPRIVYRGFMGFRDVIDLYRSADLVLNLRVTRALGTRHFFPSKLMELMASGTPVLSTCTGHVEEEFGDYLYLLRDETPEALAARLLEIAAADAAARAALGRRGRAFVLEHKTWTKQGQKLADYLREVVRSQEPINRERP
jgi:glycosyltransferase involved in cell wall biosynthesis